MKKCLWVLLNKSFKNDLELLYGKGSSIDIIEVKKCTTNKKFLINCKLNLTNIEYFKEIQEEGVHHLLQESWEYTGFGDEVFILSLSYELL